jgi:ubiquinone/menaquinone biosynthesis C-methylase UbiE
LDYFDWYQRYSGLKQIITKHAKVTHKILYVGCGTSRLPEEMSAYGYKDINGIDWSSVLITHLQEKYKDQSGLTCKFHHDCSGFCSNRRFLVAKMSALSLELADNQFDVVIDKGTLDSVLVSFYEHVKH